MTMTLEEAFMAWRKERVSVEHIEYRPILDHEELISPEWPEWSRIKSMIQEDDELWTFCSPQEEWDKFMGWQGIALVRAGKLVDVCVTAQN